MPLCYLIITEISASSLPYFFRCQSLENRPQIFILVLEVDMFHLEYMVRIRCLCQYTRRVENYYHLKEQGKCKPLFIIKRKRWKLEMSSSLEQPKLEKFVNDLMKLFVLLMNKLWTNFLPIGGK